MTDESDPTGRPSQVGTGYKVLVGPGFAKCGTTLLHDALSAAPNFHAPTGPKETCYFQRPPQSHDYGDFTRLFAKASGKVPTGGTLFDLSPQYATFGVGNSSLTVLKSIKALLPDARLVYCIRHPLARAYSHYVHDLRTFIRSGAFSWVQSPNPEWALNFLYGLDFPTALTCQSSLMRSYTEELSNAVDIFGADRIKLFFLERDTRRFGAFYADLCAFMGIADDGTYAGRATIPPVLESSGMPKVQIVPPPEGAGRSSTGAVRQSAEVDLGDKKWRINGLTRMDAARLEAAAATWTREVPADIASQLFNRWFAADARSFTDLVRSAFPGEADVPDYATMPLPRLKAKSVGAK